MANKMRYRWGALSLKWIDKTTTAAVEQGDMMQWASGGTITMCTASGDATELVGIAMSASPATDESGQSVRIAEIGHGTVFEMTVTSATYTVGTYFKIAGNQTLETLGEIASFSASGTNAVAVCIQEATLATELLVQFLPGLFQAEILAL